MAKILDPKEIEALRKTSTRAERREQERQRINEDIARSRSNGGVQVIPPPQKMIPEGDRPKLRVAAYCRVSTQEEQQVGSFERQVRYFREKIEGNPAWALVEIYQDEGISGTSVNKRLGFQKMMADAMEGKIDLILTMGINRFGRNIVDILNNLRILAGLDPQVTVIFENENITSIGDGSNNLLIAILSALAEMESQQKSEAIKAGIRWRMGEGIYKFSVHNTLGYYRDHFGRLVIEPTEAKIVEYIYANCLEGASPGEIAAALTEQGIKSPRGMDRWRASSVKGILRNEKYCGDALMQKTYTKDFRTHKSVRNTELNMYFSENHHAAIIAKKDWKRVQEVLAQRKRRGRRQALRTLSSRVVATRVKHGFSKGYFILDPRWTVEEREEFLRLLDKAQNI